jgi:hypothetical protein
MQASEDEPHKLKTKEGELFQILKDTHRFWD